MTWKSESERHKLASNGICTKYEKQENIRKANSYVNDFKLFVDSKPPTFYLKNDEYYQFLDFLTHHSDDYKQIYLDVKPTITKKFKIHVAYIEWNNGKITQMIPIKKSLFPLLLNHSPVVVSNNQLKLYKTRIDII